MSRPLSPGSDGSSAHSVDVAGQDLVDKRKLLYSAAEMGDIPNWNFSSMKFPLNEDILVPALQVKYADERVFDEKLLEKSKEMIKSVLEGSSFEWVFDNENCIILAPTDKAMQKQGYYVGLIRQCNEVNPRLQPDHAVAIFVKEETKVENKADKTGLPLASTKLINGGYKATAILAVVELKTYAASGPCAPSPPTTNIIDAPNLTLKKYEYITQELSYVLCLAWSGVCCCGVKRDEVPWAVIVSKKTGIDNNRQLCYMHGALIPPTICCGHFRYRLGGFDTFKKEHNAGYKTTRNAQKKKKPKKPGQSTKESQPPAAQQTEVQKQAERVILKRAATAYKFTVLFGFDVFMEFLAKRIAGEVSLCPLSGHKLIIQSGGIEREMSDADSKVEAGGKTQVLEVGRELKSQGDSLSREGTEMIYRGNSLISQGNKYINGLETLDKGHEMYTRDAEYGHALIIHGTKLLNDGDALILRGEALILRSGHLVSEGVKPNVQLASSTSVSRVSVQLYPVDNANSGDSLAVLAIPANIRGLGKFVSQGDLFEGKISHKTMQNLRNVSLANGNKSLWFCKPDEAAVDLEVLVKVSSAAVHPQVGDLGSAWSALEKAKNLSDVESLKSNLSKVLVVVFDVDLGLVTIMRDLRKEGYQELTLSETNERGETFYFPLGLIWIGVEDLVFGTLVPLARLEIVHCDIRPGFDVTSNILMKDTETDSKRSFDLILIDLESLVTLKTMKGALSLDGRYVTEGLAGNAFAYLFWQCFSIGYVWSRQLTQEDLQHKNSGVLNAVIKESIKRAKKPAGPPEVKYAGKQEYKFVNYLLQYPEVARVLAEENNIKTENDVETIVRRIRWFFVTNRI